MAHVVKAANPVGGRGSGCAERVCAARVCAARGFVWLGVLVGLTGCSEPGQPIPRGSKHPAPQPVEERHTESIPERAPLTSEVSTETKDSIGRETGENERVVGEQKSVEQSRPTLDWSLPVLEWQDLDDEGMAYNEGRLHDGIMSAFRTSSLSEESIEWSGRLHWDESEQGEEKPLTESVTGAELEIRFRLP